jgi:hypothetical protein
VQYIHYIVQYIHYIVQYIHYIVQYIHYIVQYIHYIVQYMQFYISFGICFAFCVFKIRTLSNTADDDQMIRSPHINLHLCEKLISFQHMGHVALQV